MKLQHLSLAAALALGSILPAQAKVLETGYYRICNNVTGRYAYVIDDYGEVNLGATSVDLGAIMLYRHFDRAISDPSTVIYFQHAATASKVSDKYDLQTQGLSMHKLIGYHITLSPVSGKNGVFYAYATDSGMTKYLGDAFNDTEDESVMTDRAKGDLRHWRLVPIDESSTAGFGIDPEVTADNKPWASLFASFPFTPAEGMTVYTVDRIENGYAIIHKVEGSVPGGEPVIVECASVTPSGNLVKVGPSSPSVTSSPTSKPVDGKLQGVYFNNAVDKTSPHYNRYPCDRSRMRILGLTSEGHIGFVTPPAGLDFMPRNRSFLRVPAGTPAELPALTEEQYKNGIDDVIANGDSAPFDVYNLAGMKVRSGVTSFEGLPSGLYIARGQKVMVP